MSPQCYFCRSKNGGRALEFERSQQISGRWDDGGGERNEGGQGSHRIPPGSRTPRWRNASSVMQNAWENHNSKTQEKVEHLSKQGEWKLEDSLKVSKNLAFSHTPLPNTSISPAFTQQAHTILQAAFHPTLSNIMRDSSLKNLKLYTEYRKLCACGRFKGKTPHSGMTVSLRTCWSITYLLFE